MLPKPLRLRHPADFARLRREGTAYRHPWMLLSVCPNDVGHNRYGFVTSKALGNAVVRNRTKRQLRAAIHDLHPTLRTSYDVVVVARKAVVGQPFAEVARIVHELANKAKLMKQDDTHE